MKCSFNSAVADSDEPLSELYLFLIRMQCYEDDCELKTGKLSAPASLMATPWSRHECLAASAYVWYIWTDKGFLMYEIFYR